MNWACVTAGILWCGLAAALAGEAAAPTGGLANPFFPYCVNIPDKTLEELGYAPIRNVYTGIHIGKEPPYAASLKDQIRKLKGTTTIFWLTVSGSRANIAESDAKCVEILRDLAAVAEEAGVRIALYPHAGNYVATAREGLRLVKKVERVNVGLTLTLCHELHAGNWKELPQILEEAAPHLFVVAINGADKKEPGEKMGWDRLIQPLGQGNLDMLAFLRKLKAVGFNGPVALQCYNLPGASGGKPGDPLVHLKQSIKAWRDYSAALAAEAAGTK